jgi:hypothetical protein
MSEEPKPGDNLAHVNKLTSEMQHHAGLWSRDVGQAEKHEREILVRAYELCLWAEGDPNNDVVINGLIVSAGIPYTKKSHKCTQVLHYAFNGAKVKPEPSQLSRWAWTIQHALDQNPRPPPSELLAFIEKEGGTVKCREKSRSTRTVQPTKKTEPIPCNLPDELNGKTVKLRKDAAGKWSLEIKVVSDDTTSVQEEHEPEEVNHA